MSGRAWVARICGKVGFLPYPCLKADVDFAYVVHSCQDCQPCLQSQGQCRPACQPVPSRCRIVGCASRASKQAPTSAIWCSSRWIRCGFSRSDFAQKTWVYAAGSMSSLDKSADCWKHAGIAIDIEGSSSPAPPLSSSCSNTNALTQSREETPHPSPLPQGERG